MTALRPPVLLDRTARVGVAWRAALILVAAVAVALEAPAWIRLPLSAAALLALAVFFLRRYGRRGVLDVVLVVVGGGVVALVLLGLVLNALPVGLGSVGWGAGIGLLELAVLAFLALFRAPVASPTRPARRVRPAAIAWAAGAAAVLVGAIAYSTLSFDATHVQPLAVAAVPDGDSATVTVSAGDAQGPFRLDLVTADGRSTIARDIRITGGRGFTTRVRLPEDRAVLQLVPSGSSSPVRQLILDPATGEAR